MRRQGASRASSNASRSVSVITPTCVASGSPTSSLSLFARTCLVRCAGRSPPIARLDLGLPRMWTGSAHLRVRPVSGVQEMRYRNCCSDVIVDKPGGVSPPGSPGTLHEPLDSHGSRCLAVAMTQRPVSEELRCRPAQPVEPVSRPLGLMDHQIGRAHV